MTLDPILFYALAVLTSACAVGVVVSQNIVRAAVWLLFTLCGTAGIYFLLGAHFIGAAQLLVYVGGTLVLVVFGVMLTAQGPFINLKIAAGEWAIAAVVGIGFFSLLAFTLINAKFDFPVPEQSQVATTAPLAAGAADGDPLIGDKGTGHRSLAASVVLGEALLGFEKTAPEAAVTGPRDVMAVPAPLPGMPPPSSRQARLVPVLKRQKMAYLLPFEIVSVHLLVVLIGAAYLARSKRRRGGA